VLENATYFFLRAVPILKAKNETVAVLHPVTAGGGSGIGGAGQL
jgi:hypothetical protein